MGEDMKKWLTLTIDDLDFSDCSPSEEARVRAFASIEKTFHKSILVISDGYKRDTRSIAKAKWERDRNKPFPDGHVLEIIIYVHSYEDLRPDFSRLWYLDPFDMGKREHPLMERALKNAIGSDRCTFYESDGYFAKLKD